MPKRTHGLPEILTLLAGGFNEETARLLYAQGEEIATFVMMQLAALAVKTSQVNGVHPNDVHPSEPSGSVAVFLKEPRKKRRKKPGRSPVTRVRIVRRRPTSRDALRMLRRVARTAAASGC